MSGSIKNKGSPLINLGLKTGSKQAQNRLLTGSKQVKWKSMKHPGFIRVRLIKVKVGSGSKTSRCNAAYVQKYEIIWNIGFKLFFDLYRGKGVDEKAALTFIRWRFVHVTLLPIWSNLWSHLKINKWVTSWKF